MFSFDNLLLTKRERHTGKYWPEVVSVRTKKTLMANVPQYGPQQVRLVSYLLCGAVSLSDRILLRLVSVRIIFVFHQQNFSGNLSHLKLKSACKKWTVLIKKINYAVVKSLVSLNLIYQESNGSFPW